MAILSRLAFIFLFCGSLLALAPGARAQSGPSKDEVKAGFLFNFTKFVEWPANALPAPTTPIRIGVYGGDDAFTDTLEQMVRGKKVDERAVVVERYDTLPPGAPHILYVAPAERRQFRRVIQNLADHPVLTVSEADGFCEAGGIVNFRMEGRKVRFDINPKAAEAQRLKLSSKLLSVAAKLVESQAAP